MPSLLCTNCGHAFAKDIEVPISPVPELLHGHLTPSTSQTHMIRDTVSAAQSQISQLDSEIARLMSKRGALQRYTQLHISLMAPIQRLLPEILSEIFLNCLEEDWLDCTSRRKSPRLDKAPLLLGNVCSRWRSITLSNQRLWTSFTLTIRLEYLKQDVLLAQTWLGRSGTCPLSINLGSEGSFQNILQPLMHVFVQNCERWRDVRLSLPICALDALLPVKNRLPNLQQLFIDGSWGRSPDIFEWSPQLRSLTLASHISPSMIKVPWNQLKYCSTGYFDVDRSLDILHLTPNLVECETSSSNFPPRGPQFHVQLPHLRSITICGDPSHFLDKLLAPSLREVSICVVGYPWRSTQQLTSLFSRCSVRIFRFHSPSFEHRSLDVDLIQLLEASPALVEIDLRGYCTQAMTKWFLKRFACHRGPEGSSVPRLVPMLHTLRVDYSPSRFDIEEFADAIQSRMSFSALKRVEVHYMETGSFDPILSRLYQLQDIGLDISYPGGHRILLQV